MKSSLSSIRERSQVGQGLAQREKLGFSLRLVIFGAITDKYTSVKFNSVDVKYIHTHTFVIMLSSVVSCFAPNLPSKLLNSQSCQMYF